MKLYPRQRHRVLAVVTRLLFPFIALFALYVQFHGDYGPGGGFQAGVILAAGFILYGLIFGVQRLRVLVPPSAMRLLMAAGVLLYAAGGVVPMLLGVNLLDYGALAHDPVHGQHYGIITIELGVGITVTAVMTSLFHGFASQRDPASRADGHEPPGALGRAEGEVRPEGTSLHPGERPAKEPGGDAGDGAAGDGVVG